MTSLPHEMILSHLERSLRSLAYNPVHQLLDNISIHHMLVPNIYLSYTTLLLSETSPSAIFLQT